MKVSFYTNRNIPYATMCKEYRHSEPQPNTEPNTVINFGSKGVGRKVAAAFATSALLSLPLVTTRLAKNEGVTQFTAKTFGRSTDILKNVYLSKNSFGKQLSLVEAPIDYIIAHNKLTNAHDTLYFANNGSHSWVAKDAENNLYLMYFNYLTKNPNHVASDTDNSVMKTLINITELKNNPNFAEFLNNSNNVIGVESVQEGFKFDLDTSIYNIKDIHAYYDNSEFIKALPNSKVDLYLQRQ